MLVDSEPKIVKKIDEGGKSTKVGITSLRPAYISNKQTKKFTLYLRTFIRFKASDKLSSLILTSEIK